MTPKVTTMGGEVAWRYKTQEELELTSPQRHHGVSSEREEAKRLAYSSLLRDAGETLKIPMLAVAAATMLCHRFYAIQSMRSYDSWVMATACLFLGCKVTETPKALKDVVRNMWAMRHRGKVPELACLEDPDFRDTVRAAVLRGERALLYTMSFDFKVELPYQTALNLIKDLNLAGSDPDHPVNPDLMQTTWDVINLSLRTTLNLQVSPDTIAAAAVLLAMKLHNMPAKLINGKHWMLHEKCNADPKKVEVAVDQLLDVAQKLRQFAAKRAAPKELVSLLQQQHGGEPSSLVLSLAAGGQGDAGAAADGAQTAQQQDQQQQAGGGGLTPATPQIGEAAMDTQT